MLNDVLQTHMHAFAQNFVMKINVPCFETQLKSTIMAVTKENAHHRSKSKASQIYSKSIFMDIVKWFADTKMPVKKLHEANETG